MAKRAYKAVSTNVLTAISDCILEIRNNHISVINKTDGDLEIYINETDNPVLIIPSGVGLAYDDFLAQGQVYIKNSTGTGGEVYIHVWKREHY